MPATPGEAGGPVAPYRVWFERKPPAPHIALLESAAVIAGSATDTPGSPLTALPGSHAIIASAGIRYDAELMDSVPTLRVISRTGVGIDNIAVDEATARGIAVCNVPNGATVSTAEHTVALLFAVAKRIQAAQAALTMRKQDLLDELEALELKRVILGIVGLGKIGRHVARIAIAVGMRVLAHDPYVNSHKMTELGVESAATLEELLEKSRIVSLHAPLTQETRKLINRERLAMMRPGAILINTARGGLVDENALLHALETGRLSGAGLDVFDPEPPAPDNPLLGRPDVIATPHIATATTAARERLWRTAISQAMQVLRGERPPNLVNPEVWPDGTVAASRSDPTERDEAP